MKISLMVTAEMALSPEDKELKQTYRRWEWASDTLLMITAQNEEPEQKDEDYGNCNVLTDHRCSLLRTILGQKGQSRHQQTNKKPQKPNDWWSLLMKEETATHIYTQRARTDRRGQTARTDRRGQRARTDRRGQKARTDKRGLKVRTDTRGQRRRQRAQINGHPRTKGSN